MNTDCNLPVSWTVRLLAVTLLVTIALQSGCVEGRSSTHELEHVIPAHWPTDLADAADKIEARLNDVDSANVAAARQELVDILGWLPEVAADTDLRETDWVPLERGCTELHMRLKESGNVSSVTDDLKALCEKLRKSETSH